MNAGPKQQGSQSHQPHPSSLLGGGGVKWIAIGGGALLVLLAAGVVAASLLVPGIRGTEPEGTARYFPEDTVVYAWATFSPGIGPGRRMLDIWDRFDELPAFTEAVDDLLEELEDETGIDFEEGVLPWVGPDLSLGVMNAAGDSGDVVGLVGVKDRAAAADFVRDLLEYMEEEGTDLRREDDLHGFDVWADPDTHTAVALSGDWLVIADGEEALRDVLDLIAGGDAPSLADSARFREARAAMSGDRAMSLYVDLEEAAGLSGFGADVVSEVTGVDLTPGADAAEDLGAPDWLAASVVFIDRGIAVEAVVPFGSDFIGGFALADDPAKLLPDDTLFLAAASFESDVDRWQDELQQWTLADLLGYDIADEMTAMLADEFDGDLRARSTLADALDFAIALIDDATDIDLEQDLFDHLGGEAAFAVRDFDFDRVEDTERYAVDAVVLLSHVLGGQAGLMRTVDALIDLLEEASGEEFPARVSADIGADHEAVMFDVEALVGQTAYSPGYVFHGGYMAVGSTRRALEAVVDARGGGRAALDGDAEYRRVRDSLPDALQLLMFLDLHRIIVGLGPGDLDLDRDDYETLERAFGAVAVSASTDADYSRASFVLTLFPE